VPARTATHRQKLTSPPPPPRVAAQDLARVRLCADAAPFGTDYKIDKDFNQMLDYFIIESSHDRKKTKTSASSKYLIKLTAWLQVEAGAGGGCDGPSTSDGEGGTDSARALATCPTLPLRVRLVFASSPDGEEVEVPPEDPRVPTVEVLGDATIRNGVASFKVRLHCQTSHFFKNAHEKLVRFVVDPADEATRRRHPHLVGQSIEAKTLAREARNKKTKSEKQRRNAAPAVAQESAPLLAVPLAPPAVEVEELRRVRRSLEASIREQWLEISHLRDVNAAVFEELFALRRQVADLARTRSHMEAAFAPLPGPPLRHASHSLPAFGLPVRPHRV